MTTSPIRILFGAGGIGKGNISHTWTNADETSQLLEQLQQLGLTELDSGAAYPPGSPWTTERLLGESKAAEKGFVIDTKILPSGRSIDGVPSGLSEESIEASLKKSLELLGVEKVNILFSHVPDLKVPAEESARAFDKQYRAGLFKELGLSNYSVSQMREWLDVCEKNSYVKPTVWQGHYNAIERSEEAELFPFLKKNGIRIYAYGPLAGGFLTGKVTLATEASTELTGTRWAPGNFPVYPETFDKPEIHNAMLAFCNACKEAGVTPTEVSLRWITHHSVLTKGDAIILGATKIEQLKASLEICKKGPLSRELVKACDVLWEGAHGDMNKMFTGK